MGQKQRLVSVSTETYWDPSLKAQRREKGPGKRAIISVSQLTNTQVLGLRTKGMEKTAV